jgi:spore maturation protein CgeB
VSTGALDIVILGLSITSSWGNVHAPTYRALARGLHDRGHRVLFLERNVPWYAANRDLPFPPYGQTELYDTLSELDRRFLRAIAVADLVVVGSFVPDGRAVADWVLRHAGGVTAFYDLDTPATLAALEADRCEYLELGLIPTFDLYLSVIGGPTLDRLERELGARRALALPPSIDPSQFYPDPSPRRWAMGYLGPCSADCQPALERLLLEPARRLPGHRFVVAAPQYPDAPDWPANVHRIERLSPARHRAFYCRQRFTVNVTPGDVVGQSPGVGLLEAAACGVPIITAPWPGLETHFTPGHEILVARDSSEVVDLVETLDENQARLVGARARQRVLAAHTAQHRAGELEQYLAEVLGAERTAVQS